MKEYNLAERDLKKFDRMNKNRKGKIMNVNINKRIEDNAIQMAEEMDETLDAFVQRAIRNQLRIDSVVMEDIIEKTDEIHTYPLGRSSGSTLIEVLKHKGIDAESYKDEKRNYYLKAPISQEDFEYAKSIQTNHGLIIRLPISYEEYPDEKKVELYRMYPISSYSVPDR